MSEFITLTPAVFGEFEAHTSRFDGVTMGEQHLFTITPTVEVSVIRNKNSYGGSTGLYEACRLDDGKVGDNEPTGWLTKDDVVTFLTGVRKDATEPKVIWSQATLVLETPNSIYALTIGRSRSWVSCVRGTLENEVQNLSLVHIGQDTLAQWNKAVTGDVEEATRMAQALYADDRFPFDTAEEGSFSTTAVEVARWVISESEILEPKVRSRYTAKTFVEQGGRNLPVTKATCWACDEVVDLTATHTFDLSRVAGDSRWGYEPGHKDCNARKVMNGEMAL